MELWYEDEEVTVEAIGDVERVGNEDVVGVIVEAIKEVIEWVSVKVGCNVEDGVTTKARAIKEWVIIIIIIQRQYY